MIHPIKSFSRKRVASLAVSKMLRVCQPHTKIYIYRNNVRLSHAPLGCNENNLAIKVIKFTVTDVVIVMFSEKYVVCRFEPSSIDNPSLYGQSPLFIFIPKPPRLARLFQQYCRNEIPDKHKNRFIHFKYLN